MKQLRYILTAALALGFLAYTQLAHKENADIEPISSFGEIVERAPEVHLSEPESPVIEESSALSTSSEAVPQSETKLQDYNRKAHRDLINMEEEIADLQTRFQEKRVYVPEAKKVKVANKSAKPESKKRPDVFEEKSNLKSLSRIDREKLEKEIRERVEKALAEGSIKARDVKSYSAYLRRMALEAALEEQALSDDEGDGVFFTETTVSSIE